MKKYIIIALFIIVIVGIGAYFTIDYLGNKAFHTILGTFSPEQINELDKIANPSGQDAQAPGEQQSGEEEEQKTDKQLPNDKTSDKSKPTPGNKPNSNSEDNADKLVKQFTNKKVDFTDKVEALELVNSKFSASDIAYIRGKMSGKVTPEVVKEVKAFIKSKVTKADIQKMYYWYNKYK